MIKNSFTKKNGYSLAELLVAISIISILSIIASDYIIQSFKSMTFESEQGAAVENARKALDVISKDVRKTKNSDKGDFAIASASSQQIIFYSDTDNDLSIEKNKIYLYNNILRRDTTEAGQLLDYTGTTTTSDLSYYVNNQSEPIFSYFDSNNSTTSLINEIRLVNVKLKINVTPFVAPNDFYVETDINLRNLKDNL